MCFVSDIASRAKANPQRIVLPEGTEERTLTAADRVLAEGMAQLIILGNKDEIRATAQRLGLTNIDKATLIDPSLCSRREEYAEMLFALRKDKGLTLEQAREKVIDPLYYGCIMIKTGDADGQLAGARNTTGNVLRPALQIIKTEPGITTVSGALVLITKATQYGRDGILVVGDVAVTPLPTSDQLAEIAVCTARTARAVASFEDPKVALLSFSTKGSANHEVVDKVVSAVSKARLLDPTLEIDGELQADAAIVPRIGEAKAPGSKIAGHADTLIFPNLEVGNIAYKLVQRLGNAEAIGPILQGIASPVNDLSRGCSVNDVYAMIAITANQAIAQKKRMLSNV